MLLLYGLLFAVLQLLTVYQTAVNAKDSNKLNKSFGISKCAKTNQTIYDFSVQTLDDQSIDLSKYKGKPILIVNVATFCAFTQQYLDFNPLLDANNSTSLYIVAFPCNQFHLQEPAKNREILNGIQYVRPGNGWKPHKNLHIYGKLEVNGKNQHPLYRFLKEQCPQTVDIIGNRDELMYDVIRPNDITWNFEKFLIDQNGRVRYRFHPKAWNNGKTVQKLFDSLNQRKQ